MNRVLLTGTINPDFKISTKNFEMNNETMTETTFQFLVRDVYKENVKEQILICSAYGDVGSKVQKYKEGNFYIEAMVVSNRHEIVETGEIKLYTKFKVLKIIKLDDSEIVL